MILPFFFSLMNIAISPALYLHPAVLLQDRNPACYPDYFTTFMFYTAIAKQIVSARLILSFTEKLRRYSRRSECLTFAWQSELTAVYLILL